ncbi:MAG: hypothetical protein R3A13_04205 [Bdellovibrionota bacterium]
MRKNFRTFDLVVVKFYKKSRCLRFRSRKRSANTSLHSIALNLADGRGKRTVKNLLDTFTTHWVQSECQAILILEDMEGTEEWNLLDRLGGSL